MFRKHQPGAAIVGITVVVFPIRAWDAEEQRLSLVFVFTLQSRSWANLTATLHTHPMDLNGL